MTSKKDFDAVELMRSLRDEIDREVASLSPSQRVRYVRERAERVRQDLIGSQATVRQQKVR